MKTVKINDREVSIRKSDDAYRWALYKDGYLTDWQYKHAKYELVDLKNGNVWRAPYNLKQFMTEIMNDNPKRFK